MDEMKLRRQRNRGADAIRLWENPLLQECFTNIENRIKDELFATTGDEEKLREQLYLTMKCFGSLKQEIKGIIFTGTNAGKELVKIEKARSDHG